MRNQIEGFDKRLLEAIENKDMSNRQVALLLGIPYNCMNGYVNRGQLPTCSNLVKLAKLLGVSTDWLLGLEGS